MNAADQLLLIQSIHSTCRLYLPSFVYISFHLISSPQLILQLCSRLHFHFHHLRCYCSSPWHPVYNDAAYADAATPIRKLAADGCLIAGEEKKRWMMMAWNWYLSKKFKRLPFDIDVLHWIELTDAFSTLTLIILVLNLNFWLCACALSDRIHWAQLIVLFTCHSLLCWSNSCCEF